MFRIKYTEDPGEPGKINWQFIGNPVMEFNQMFDHFNSLYELKLLLPDDSFHKTPLKPRKDRVCRFCGIHYGEEEKFKTNAHLIPSLIGNKNLFSDFECDKCNHYFGTFETELSYFLGVSRLMASGNMPGSKITLKSPDKTLVVKKTVSIGDESSKLTIESEGKDSTHFTIDKDNKKITLHTIKHSYHPYHVYKSFLKMGLSVLPETIVPDYKDAFQILRNNLKNNSTDNPFFKLNLFQHPGPAFPSPMILLFEKKVQTQNIPTHAVCIMFNNSSYQLFLPANKNDHWMCDGKTGIHFPTMPPFIDKHFAEKFGDPKGQRLNMNSDDLKKNEKHDITGSFEEIVFTKPG